MVLLVRRGARSTAAQLRGDRAEAAVQPQLRAARRRRHVQAGNGGDPDEPWTGRSLRIGYVNASRGVGWFVHSLGHGLEGTCNSGAIPYFSYYFAQYAGFDFRRRYGMPFNDLDGSHRNGKKIRYENNAMIVPDDGQWLRIPNYVAAGGNVHFPPNGREDYDDNNTQPVPSTIEDWRIGSGPGHRDLVKPFTNAVFAKYNAVAPDGGGVAGRSAAKHARAEQPPERRLRPADEELVAVLVLLMQGPLRDGGGWRHVAMVSISGNVVSQCSAARRRRGGR